MFQKIIADLLSIVNPAYISFAGAMLVALGVLLAHFEKQQKENEKLERELKFQTELRDKNEELVAQSNKVAELSERIRNLVTGGNSYCYFAPLQNGTAPESWVVVPVGEFPLYDVKAEITDLQKIRELGPNPTLAQWSSAKSSITLGTIQPELAQNVGNIFGISGDYRSFRIHFSARNGMLTQTIKMRLINGRWVVAMRVSRMSDNKVLLESIPNNFPRGANGEMDWSNN